jgi:ABC-type enterochelin transport system permease subunit
MEEKEFLENKEAGDVKVNFKVSKESIRKFIFYFDKAVMFIFSLALVWIASKAIYDGDLLKDTNSFEIILAIGFVVGIWITWSFLFVVFIDYKEYEKSFNKRKKSKSEDLDVVD